MAKDQRDVLLGQILGPVARERDLDGAAHVEDVPRLLPRGQRKSVVPEPPLHVPAIHLVGHAGDALTFAFLARPRVPVRDHGARASTDQESMRPTLPKKSRHRSKVQYRAPREVDTVPAPPPQPSWLTLAG